MIVKSYLLHSRCSKRNKASPMSHSISCTYIGHATNIIRMGETTILTDPHFGKRTLTQKRLVPLPVEPGNLPDFNAILLSHTHFDHLHVDSYKYISCHTPIVVPEGSERAIGQYMPSPVIELSHYASHELADGTEITAVPVIHKSWRACPLLFKKSNAYLIRHPGMDGSVLFCGDSAYGPHFGQIGNLGKISVAFLPIGPYKPRWIMKGQHMTPAEAVQAFEDSKALHMIPIHYGTFRLSMEAPGAPLAWLKKILVERTDLASRVHVLEPGREFTVDQEQ